VTGTARFCDVLRERNRISGAHACPGRAGNARPSDAASNASDTDAGRRRETLGPPCKKLAG